MLVKSLHVRLSHPKLTKLCIAMTTLHEHCVVSNYPQIDVFIQNLFQDNSKEGI